MTTTIQINSTQVDNALAELARRTSHLQPAFNEIGLQLHSNVVDCFQHEQSPDGINWAALSPTTLSKRHGTNANILRDTGSMYASLGHNATNDHVEITIGQNYAAMMNFGGTKAQFPHLWGDIPARPFMPTEQLPALWQDEILAVIRQHLEL